MLDIINQAKTVAETSRISLGKKIMLQLTPKPNSTEAFTSVSYEKVKDLLDVRLVDFKYKSGKEYLDGIKSELKDTLRSIMRF
jgi:hypothetical protein